MDREALDSITSEFSQLTRDKDCVFLPYKNINFLVIRHRANQFQICPEYPSQFSALPEHDQIAAYFSRLNIEFSPNEKGGMLCGTFNMVGDDDINETNDYDGKDGNETYDRDSDDDEGKSEGKSGHK